MSEINFYDVLQSKYSQPESPKNQFDFDELNTPEKIRGVLEKVERDVMHDLLIYNRSNQAKSAKMLEWNRGTFRKRLKKYGWLPRESEKE